MHMDDMAQGKRAPCPYVGCLGLRFGQKLFQTELQGDISRSAPAKQKIWYFSPELNCPSVHNWATHLALSNSRGHLHWSTWATVRNSENPVTVTVTYRGVRLEPLGAARLEAPRLQSKRFGCCCCSCLLHLTSREPTAGAAFMMHTAGATPQLSCRCP